MSAYSHNPLNVGPNFYNLVADHEKWRAYHGDFDMVDGSAMRGWTKQDWATADKDFDSTTSKASDWRRFAQLRKRWLGAHPL